MFIQLYNSFLRNKSNWKNNPHSYEKNSTMRIKQKCYLTVNTLHTTLL